MPPGLTLTFVRAQNGPMVHQEGLLEQVDRMRAAKPLPLCSNWRESNQGIAEVVCLIRGDATLRLRIETGGK